MARDKVKLYVINTTTHFKENTREAGVYVLIHPQMLMEQRDILFGFFGVNHKAAVERFHFADKANVLNEVFGADNWEIEFKAIKVRNVNEEINSFFVALDTTSGNERIDTKDLLDKLKKAQTKVMKERTS